MDYGYFDDTNRTYVITNPHTPVKWINYIGTLNFGGFVDHTGGALICKGDPALNRITKYISQLPAADFKGETIYLRIKRAGGYQVFSPFYVPTLDPYDRYECHVCLGYTRIISEFYGLRTEVTIFVPVGADCEIRDIRITNLGKVSLEVDAIPVVEYTHPDALKQFTNADWVPQTMQSKMVPLDSGRIVLLQYPFMFRDLKINYFTSNLPVSSYESDRKAFLGVKEYTGWVHPQGLQSEELGNSEAMRGDNITALLHHLGMIKPGGTRRLITQLGQAPNLPIAIPSIEKYRQPTEVDKALESQARYWDGYLSRFQVETPDANMNRMLNVYNPRQCYITKNWSRYLSLYQLGFGSRGIGFRDSSQDVMGIISNTPEEAKLLVRMLLQIQKRNGSAMHQVNPLSMVANEGDSLEMEDRPHYYSDDHLWIVLAITSYLKESGDFSFLREKLPYYEKDGTGQPLEAGTVFARMQRALRFTHKDLGVHGLPLLGFADWNDTINLPRGAESLFTANLYGKALLEMIDLTHYLKDERSVEKYQAWYDEMRQRVNQCAWDGDWYVSYFDADGTPLGSKVNNQGKIYAYGQSWPTISGFATPDRARIALDSVYHNLNTRHGIKLSAPGFNGYEPAKGGITTYPPGAKENGGIFLHANPWVIIAEAKLGNGDRAFEYYDQINPAAQNGRIDEYECEPYVYPQNILGDEHPQFGLARNSWLTGAASWVYQAATQYILGIRAHYTGLLINPCIPRSWDHFNAVRVFRNTRYEIEVCNPEHINQGVLQLVVDGQELQDKLVPIFTDKETHRVLVTLGKDA
jgi:cellobiose phosphorylase